MLIFNFANSKILIKEKIILLLNNMYTILLTIIVTFCKNSLNKYCNCIFEIDFSQRINIEKNISH